jgi:ribosome-associated translation inhibitor RaiA
MQIQINTDHTIKKNEATREEFIRLITVELKNFSQHITRIEVHFTDENGNKTGQMDKKCLMEARIEGRQPIAVNDHSNTEALALDGAIEKLKHALDSMLGSLKNH